MKRIFLVTIVISILLCVTACEKDYPEEVTYSGRGILGFKLDGKNWVTAFLLSFLIILRV